MVVGVNFRLCSSTSKISRTAASTELTSPVITSAPLKRSINPNVTSDALVATSAAIIAPSLGVIVKIPIALIFSTTSPSFL